MPPLDLRASQPDLSPRASPLPLRTGWPIPPPPSPKGSGERPADLGRGARWEMPLWPFPGPGHMVASAHTDHQPWGASCLQSPYLGSGSCLGAGPPATCQEPGGAESSATGILSCLGSHCLELRMGSVFQAHLTKTFWNIPPPASPKTGFQTDNRSPGSPDPRAQIPGPGLAFPGPHQAATWGGPGGQQGGRDPAPPTEQLSRHITEQHPKRMLHRGRSDTRISTNV